MSTTTLIFLGVCLVSVSGKFLIAPKDTGLDAVRKAYRRGYHKYVLHYTVNLPWLGFGPWCNGCPAIGCEDDEAIIHGYCCGCAYAMDLLPVLCPQFLQCPLNLHGLCHDYEYMIRCCC